MGAADFEETDYAYIRETIFHPEWTPDPLPSSAWRGIVQENAALDPNPTPTASGDPTVYAAWNIAYDSFDGCYDGDVSPVRYGRLTVSRYIQKGAKMGPLRDLRTAILRQIAAAPDDPLGFDIQSAKSVTVGYVGPWFVQNLVVPFAGC